jgi:hypothetical protein
LIATFFKNNSKSFWKLNGAAKKIKLSFFEENVFWKNDYRLSALPSISF